MKYPVVFERTGTAYVIDIDGCVATGATLEEIRENIRGAVTMHVAGIREEGDWIPEPSVVEFVEIPFPV